MGKVENGLYTVKVSGANVEAVFIPEEIQNFQHINKHTKARRDQRERDRLDATRREEEAAQRHAKACRKHARSFRRLMKWELGLLAVALISYLGISFSWVTPGFGVAVIVCCLVVMSFLAGRFKGAGYQALLMGRRHIGIELKESYFNLAVENCRNAERQSAVAITEQATMFDLMEQEAGA